MTGTVTAMSTATLVSLSSRSLQLSPRFQLRTTKGARAFASASALTSACPTKRTKRQLFEATSTRTQSTTFVAGRSTNATKLQLRVLLLDHHRRYHQQLQQQLHSWRFFSTDSTSSASASTSATKGVPASWKQMYDLLAEYHKEHGSTIVPLVDTVHTDTDADEDGNKSKNSNNNDDHATHPSVHHEIGKWVKVQRSQSRRLSQEQKTLLNQLGFVWDHQEAQWLEKYERLCDYESNLMKTSGRQGGLDLKEISKIRTRDLESVFEKRYQNDPVLRRWVNAQRKNYRSESISVERVQLLEQVEGFVWDVKEARWFEMHRRLSLFAKTHQTCIVPQRYEADPQLACWVNNQRQRKHQLSAERITMLDALGFVWDVQELQWMENYQNYKAVFFGGANSNHTNDELKRDPKEQQPLIDWAIKQRVANRNGTLAAHRKQLLDDLVHPMDGSEFVWDPQDKSWMEMYEELLEYRTIHKHVMVPTRSTRYDNEESETNDDNDDDDEDASTSSSSASGRQLGIWVANQRRNFKKGILSKKRQKLLEDIEFVWDAPEAMWNDQYKRLLDYQKEHISEGKEASTSTLVPQNYPKDPQLAVWVKEQRQNRKNGILTTERLHLLDRIGFVWDASPSSTSPSTE